jgi:hypothetical protein
VSCTSCAVFTGCCNGSNCVTCGPTESCILEQYVSQSVLGYRHRCAQPLQVTLRYDYATRPVCFGAPSTRLPCTVTKTIASDQGGLLPSRFPTCRLTPTTATAFDVDCTGNCGAIGPTLCGDQVWCRVPWEATRCLPAALESCAFPDMYEGMDTASCVRPPP